MTEHTARQSPQGSPSEQPPGTQSPGTQPSGGPAGDEDVPGLVPDQASADRAASAGPLAGHQANDELPSSSYLLRVNGDAHQVNDAWVGESLLFVLRSRLGLTGAKDGCGSGDCGACSVLLDDVLVCACLVPAVTVAGREVRSIEGLSAGNLTDVQLALLAAGGVQCGFCTPALTLALHALLVVEPEPDEARIREALVGNMCRCTGFGRVLAAARLVIDRRRDADDKVTGSADSLVTEKADAPITERADTVSDQRRDISARVGGLVPRLDAMPLIEQPSLDEMTTIEGVGARAEQPPGPGEPR